LICRRLGAGIVVCLCILTFAACEYEVPITPSATGKAQEQLLGNWVSLDGKENMSMRRLDDSTYVVYYDGDLFRAFFTPTLRKHRLSVFRISTQTIANMLTWFGSCRMTVSV
jgi:hypothetical protein